MIEVQDLTLKYLNGNGVFDLNFLVKKGEVVGLIGPETAGKTTIIRLLMGFHRSSRGQALINGMNTFLKASAIKKNLGYIPEDPAFFEGMRVKSYLDFMSRLRRTNSAEVKQSRNELSEIFNLDQSARIDRMGSEDKQKLSIVAAFMHDPEIYIFDEPFKHLNPALESKLANLIIEEKKKGKTFFLTSQMFSEVERVADRVALLRSGRLLELDDVITLKAKEIKSYRVKFSKSPNLDQFKKFGFGYKRIDAKDFEIFAPGNRIDALIKVLSHENVLIFNSNEQTLEESFQNFYSRKVEEI
ncbi:ABC transporter ATP-binding protein [Eubacteriaceae bacterium ES3]|nr:ABC transporter ATP-binding protein [Eubacteriaceae bacterium ES3]